MTLKAKLTQRQIDSWDERIYGPLVLVPELTWQKPLIPTLEGQYIIKNVAIVALAFDVAAHTRPLSLKRSD
jgi:hypothetical protein